MRSKKTGDDTWNHMTREATLSADNVKLISFARTIVSHDPKVLILEWATSKVFGKQQTEILLQEGLDRLLEGRTAFINCPDYSKQSKNSNKMFYIAGKISRIG